MYGFIYLATCLSNGYVYVGQRKSKGKHLDDKYIGSGYILKLMLKKYGKESFVRQTICECENQDELNEKEIFYINHYKSILGKKCINIALGGQFGGSPLLNHPNKKEIYRRISLSNKANTSRKPLSHLGFKHSESAKHKMSIAKKGKPPWNKGVTMSQKIIESMSKRMKGSTPWNKGKKLTDAQKANLYRHPKGSPSVNKGKKATPETVEKIRLAAMGNKNMLGKKHTEQTKMLISKANKGNRPGNAKEICKINPHTMLIEQIFSTRKMASDSTSATTCHRAAKSDLRLKSNGWYWKYFIDLTPKEIEANSALIAEYGRRKNI